MKTILLFLILFLSANIIFAQGLQLTGEIKGLNNDKLVISERIDRFNVNPIDSVEVIQGKFTYNNPSINTDTYHFKLSQADVVFYGILEPGKIHVTGDIKDAERGYLITKFTGGQNEKLLEEFSNIREELLKNPRFDAYNKCMDRLRNSSNKEESDKIREELSPLQKELDKELYPLEQEWFKRNANTYAAQSQMAFRFSAYTEFLVDLSKTIPEKNRNVSLWPNIQKEIDAYEATRPGKIAPDFTLPTPDGKEISLSDLKGKYVLLDFWASWCAPCRKSFPKLKELYAEYKDKGFEILSITNDTDHDKWKKAIEEDQTPWLHVADEFPKPPAPFGPAKIIGVYGFHFLPSTILIDPEGKIVKTLKGEEEIEAKLKEIFG